ncbi:hypothetical protein ACT4R9_11355 [Ornithobacterium rhinotracheale]|uniref:hypothetical protein n=1 Tax=Ornithobacterium rhinotracheale TaxID=28251 RepID=UPI003FA4D271
MKANKDYIEEKTKILKGLGEAYKKLLDTKKKRKGELVILKDNKIINISYK